MQPHHAAPGGEETGESRLGVGLFGEEGQHAGADADHHGNEEDQRGALRQERWLPAWARFGRAGRIKVS